MIRFNQNIKNIYQYSFQSEPSLTEQSRQILIQVTKNAEPQLKNEIGIFSYNGNMVWATKPIKYAFYETDQIIKYEKKYHNSL